jgi:[ribosomal protein S5]-alanine N-acetyltransferase
MTNFEWAAVPSQITDRLLLRSLSSKDKHDLFQIYGDPEVMRFASDPAFPDESYVDQMLESVNRLFASRESLEWGIVLIQEARLVGTCGFHCFAVEQTQAEIGCLLARAYWRQGIMTEALKQVIRFGFAELELQTIVADVDADNSRSLTLFDRLGFVLEEENQLRLRA